jgi:hypothetical protein
VPFLLCLIGPALLWVLTGTALRDHYAATLTWFTAAVVWVGGAPATPDYRLWWWTTAAALELAGTWLPHPVPRRHRFRTQEVSFDPGHMHERSRLFLIICVGRGHPHHRKLSRQDRPVSADDRHRRSGDDRDRRVVGAVLRQIRQAHRGTGGHRRRPAPNGATDREHADPRAGQSHLGAGANDLAIEDPTGRSTAALSLLMFGGPMLYVAVQHWYLWAATGRRAMAGPAALIALTAGAAVTTAASPLVGVPLLCGALLVLVRLTVETGTTGQSLHPSST